MIIFDVEKLEHSPLPSFVAIKILVSIRNSTIQWCIIKEGASTYVMVANVWKKLGSPYLSPSTITLHAWDGHPSQPLGLYHNFPITTIRNIVSIDIEVIDDPLDYKILLGCTYTYAMLAVTFVVLCKI